MRLHLYASHLDDYYTKEVYDESLTDTCDICGDSDWYIGFVTKDEAEEILKGNYVEDNDIQRFIEENFN